MAKRTEIVAQAREWIGTRFQHQGIQKGVGVDCVGLLRGVSAACGIFPADPLTLPAFARFEGYALRPSRGALLAACELLGQRIEPSAAKPGDFALMVFEGQMQHVGIFGDYPGGGLSLIHAYIGLRKVVEHRIDAAWAARIVAAFEFPGVA